MQIKIHTQIADISKTEWNGLIQDNNPFLKHEFLFALEKNHCVGEKFGWLPRHIAVYDNGTLIGAMPLYEKHNSYGEFVFDNAWADAWQRANLRYFPKLVSAIPYTPATGQRLLVKPGLFEKIAPILLESSIELARQTGASGCHILFPQKNEHEWLQQQGWFSRHDCQFHWHNQDYTDFEEFLGKLKARKRKNIHKERLSVKKSGIKLRVLDGYTASSTDWGHFSHFYNALFERKSGVATLNEAFFCDVAENLPEQTILVLADKGNKCIAGALMYCSDTTLYGRLWGCIETVENLHFEACYYLGIEYCIEKGLQLFEPGAQGEHKVARGFVPTLTQSSHWLSKNPFQQAIAQYVKHEQEGVADYIAEINQRIPYKTETY
ncbi:hypothetical protein PN36_03075 [Candidatus Thiomargarita nelsonii]|uniref:GNAT family N-acetyltransferase n=1 Tax=Candidatus Thiomargarita nelsonii TaxID=1003181 RepID=A0A0A6RNH2_9GAMM|nr:hypothetical protein PN36_03075 [Candidatus Thiomargarita nelsonii]